MVGFSKIVTVAVASCFATVAGNNTTDAATTGAAATGGAVTAAATAAATAGSGSTAAAATNAANTAAATNGAATTSGTAATTSAGNAATSAAANNAATTVASSNDATQATNNNTATSAPDVTGTVSQKINYAFTMTSNATLVPAELKPALQVGIVTTFNTALGGPAQAASQVAITVTVARRRLSEARELSATAKTVTADGEITGLTAAQVAAMQPVLYGAEKTNFETAMKPVVEAAVKGLGGNYANVAVTGVVSNHPAVEDTTSSAAAMSATAVLVFAFAKML